MKRRVYRAVFTTEQKEIPLGKNFGVRLQEEWDEP